MIAGVKQNYARRCHIPIDAITFDYTCMPADTHPDSAPAEGGAYVNGMFVEGARWDHATAKLEESQPKVGIDKALYSVVWSCLPKVASVWLCCKQLCASLLEHSGPAGRFYHPR